MNGLGSLGQENFDGFFFQKIWDFISSNIYASVRQFFTLGWILQN